MAPSTDFSPAEIAAAGGHHLLVLEGAARHVARAPVETSIITVGGDSTPDVIFGRLDKPEDALLARAHQGVLVLEDVTSLNRGVLDGIRHVMDSGKLSLHRGGNQTPEVTQPANFRIIVGLHGADLRGISGPLVDRVDITAEALTEPTGDPAAITGARQAQTERLSPYGAKTNGSAPMSVLLENLRPPRAATTALNHRLDTAQITLRGYIRVLRVAWTLADLDGDTTPTAEHIDRALMLRSR